MAVDGVHGAGAFSQATGRIAGEEAGPDKPRYRQFQHDLIAPHCGRSVLEVGAGLGEFAEQLTDLDRLVVTDVDPEAVAVMRRRFAGRPEVQVRQLNLESGLELDEPVDTVVTINTLEHIEDDVAALRSLARLVVPGGTIVLWVPGYQQLYGDFDRKVGHVRRYTPATLTASFQAAGLVPTLVKPVNLLGGIAWWAAVRRSGTGSPNPRLVAVYDRVLVPMTRALERLVRVPFGQSILGVARCS
ncbi:MAG TPA: class I SAM-dependent methyltransferase [Pseudonocardiaceae bacterium]|jgi:2-polyprenyl-3-methyl-5-hydroxy-6-metoxy-1,4-benzoquinol methylase|nr:class I SAM-dependent methyltransferase [Pseudonocardiaceae bacterium]